jgi:phage-related protein
LRSCPSEVRLDIGYALYAAQRGETDPAAKPLKGFGGASVLEIVASHRGDTWRGVYAVRFDDAVYVLHVFQKKSTRGIATPKKEIELIARRLAQAERDSRERRLK